MWCCPVSYTHLDVYKRQEEMSKLPFLLGMGTQLGLEKETLWEIENFIGLIEK